MENKKPIGQIKRLLYMSGNERKEIFGRVLSVDDNSLIFKVINLLTSIQIFRPVLISMETWNVWQDDDIGVYVFAPTKYTNFDDTDEEYEEINISEVIDKGIIAGGQNEQTIINESIE